MLYFNGVLCTMDDIKFNWNNRKIHFFLILTFLSVNGCTEDSERESIHRSGQTLETVLELFDAGYNNLFHETYPYQEEGNVTYLAEEDTSKGKRVAYLWPTSGLFSGVNALLRETGDTQYAEMLKEVIIPGLENYFDDRRMPSCYQSYIAQAGKSDRFYDDNIWLALDYLEAYHLTDNDLYLDKSKHLWNFILSGWDESLGGGIYWCEQKKRSKNTCSNAPAAVLGFKLFEATRDSSFFNWGIKIYKWTQSNLQDSDDHLYFDNKSVNGRLDKRKFTYNTGQMIQASALIYKLTGDESFLKEAETIARVAIEYFTEDFITPDGQRIRLFKPSDNWFNVIMFRGYEELYKLNENPEYINVFKNNLDYLWNHVRDKNGLFSRNWAVGGKIDQPEWLLDQAAMIEFYASISKYY